MRLLLDENVPRDLSGALEGHDCVHVLDKGWAGMKNGALLAMAQEEGFHALLTSDAGVPHQNTGRYSSIALMILRPEGQGSAAVKALAPEIRRALLGITPGSTVLVTNRKNVH